VHGLCGEDLQRIARSAADTCITAHSPLNINEFHAKFKSDSLEANIYVTIRSLLSNYENQQEIKKEFPKQSIKRRNTGYV
jgi:hypothetical protein